MLLDEIPREWPTMKWPVEEKARYSESVLARLFVILETLLSAPGLVVSSLYSEDIIVACSPVLGLRFCRMEDPDLDLSGSVLPL